MITAFVSITCLAVGGFLAGAVFGGLLERAKWVRASEETGLVGLYDSTYYIRRVF